MLSRLIISRQALAREGDYKMHPVRAWMRACVRVSRRFLQNCYSYRFFCKLIVLMNFHVLEHFFGFLDLSLVTVTGKHGSNYRLSLSCNRKNKKLNLTNLFNSQQ